MSKKKFYMVVDTETATLPFADRICKSAKEKQKIAIAKPIVYDLGWVISDRQGNIVKRVNYVIQETFFVPQVFNTAYYKDKRPIYIDKINSGEIKVATWDDAIVELIKDLHSVDIATAFNATFDFKKAIPFTEQYISKLYSDDYNKWETRQYWQCKKLLDNTLETENPEFLNPECVLRDYNFNIADLWCLSCNRLINNKKYKNFCLDNNYVTASKQFFKTDAETVYKYCLKNNDFTEDHTALSDAEIECQLLTKCLRKGKVTPQLGAFPFRELGDIADYALYENRKYLEKVRDILYDYYYDCDNYEEKIGSSYWQRIYNKLDKLEQELMING